MVVAVPSLLSTLRACTAAAHTRLDDGLARAGGLDTERYPASLRASLAVVAPIEPALVRWLPAVAAPSRVAALCADLAALVERTGPATSAGGSRGASRVAGVSPTVRVDRFSDSLIGGATGAGGSLENAAPDASAAALALESLAAAWGAAYVVEGSALGGMVLAERVEAAHGAGAPTRYLRLRGRATAEHWRAFVAELARAERGFDAGEREVACAAACALFAAYEAAFVEHGVIAP